MTSLLTNTAAMTALTTLKTINQNLDTTSNRVSTGQRVAAASDNRRLLVDRHHGPHRQRLALGGEGLAGPRLVGGRHRL